MVVGGVDAAVGLELEEQEDGVLESRDAVGAAAAGISFSLFSSIGSLVGWLVSWALGLEWIGSGEGEQMGRGERYGALEFEMRWRRDRLPRATVASGFPLFSRHGPGGCELKPTELVLD
jgi:hypothetical protein